MVRCWEGETDTDNISLCQQKNSQTALAIFSSMYSMYVLLPLYFFSMYAVRTTSTVLLLAELNKITQ
jgi:hypothetical protein